MVELTDITVLGLIDFDRFFTSKKNPCECGVKFTEPNVEPGFEFGLNKKSSKLLFGIKAEVFIKFIFRESGISVIASDFFRLSNNFTKFIDLANFENKHELYQHILNIITDFFECGRRVYEIIGLDACRRASNRVSVGTLLAIKNLAYISGQFELICGSNTNTFALINVSNKLILGRLKFNASSHLYKNSLVRAERTLKHTVQYLDNDEDLIIWYFKCIVDLKKT